MTTSWQRFKAAWHRYRMVTHIAKAIRHYERAERLEPTPPSPQIRPTRLAQPVGCNCRQQSLDRFH